jgi:hypothetical protein
MSRHGACTYVWPNAEEDIMEISRSFLDRYGTGFEAYIALQCALLRRYVAAGGSPEDFCDRLAPVFRARWGPVLLGTQES